MSRVLDRHASALPTVAAVVILAVLLAGAQAYFGTFLSPRNMSALLLDHAYLVILAVGMTLVILTGGIDLSVGSVMAFTGILGAKMLAAGTSPAVVVPVMLLGGAAVGLMIGVLVQYFDVQPFIASLAGLFLARGLAYVVSLQSIKVESEASCGCSRAASRSGTGTSPRPGSSPWWCSRWRPSCCLHPLRADGVRHRR